MEKAIIIPFLDGIRVWTQGITLAKRTLYHLIHIYSPICSVYFDIFTHVYNILWSYLPLLSFSSSYTLPLVPFFLQVVSPLISCFF
jgi:hypothetical protein